MNQDVKTQLFALEYACRTLKRTLEHDAEKEPTQMDRLLKGSPCVGEELLLSAPDGSRIRVIIKQAGMAEHGKLTEFKIGTLGCPYIPDVEA